MPSSGVNRHWSRSGGHGSVFSIFFGDLGDGRGAPRSVPTKDESTRMEGSQKRLRKVGTRGWLGRRGCQRGPGMQGAPRYASELFMK
ncbi:hypothetical protein CEXT_428931 [Caerostris extrusa]|uniref:Uncharacterized protein n=1 Tax=Caerostris extrusa TaxID=172846 RepID=A0AAV4RMZ9_CAEEX|nr:hypothetical protein CEXT_428931 [Caerostris extrusa]